MNNNQIYTYGIKAGMETEFDIIKRHCEGAYLCDGRQTLGTLEATMPTSIKGIISVGLCGGLSLGHADKVGQAFIYSGIVTDTDMYPCDTAWASRLMSVLACSMASCYSSGDFDLADTVPQRAALYARTHCDVVDDESWAVAAFAKKRGIPLAGLRVISDGADRNLPPAVIDALNVNGTDNLWNIAKSVLTDPFQIPSLIRTAVQAKKAYDELGTICIIITPSFQSPS